MAMVLNSGDMVDEGFSRELPSASRPWKNREKSGRGKTSEPGLQG